MAFGKYAVDYEARIDYDRLRRERLQKAKDQLNADGLGAIITREEAGERRGCFKGMVKNPGKGINIQKEKFLACGLKNMPNEAYSYIYRHPLQTVKY